MLKSVSHRLQITIAAAAMLFGSVAASHGAGETPGVINELVGSWRGTGTAKAYADSDPETVNCKARYTLMPEKDTLRVEVTCAAANGKGVLVGFIKYAENSSTVSGNWFQKWSTSQGEENGSLTGTISDAKIVLNVSAVGKVRAHLTLTPNGQAKHTVEVVGIVDGIPQQGMEVIFRQ
ncbi:MAG: hypothetical protein K8F25_16200 [Fimbriimonadaceae bacterium]|nr:hypothetical protein [Alphaproteobacteria bacterium]